MKIVNMKKFIKMVLVLIGIIISTILLLTSMLLIVVPIKLIPFTIRLNSIMQLPPHWIYFQPHISFLLYL